MRVILDANVYISYLLGSTQESMISSIVDAAFTGRFTLLLPQDLVAEFKSVVARKRYLAQRISSAQLTDFTDVLATIAVIFPALEEAAPTATRDPGDDYLIVQALLGEAEYLVAGDDDLLAIGAVNQLQIITPAAFMTVLEAAGK